MGWHTQRALSGLESVPDALRRDWNVKGHVVVELV